MTAAELLRSYAPIDPLELGPATLLNRVDTKFVLPASALDLLLAQCSGHYHVLQIENRRMFGYHTLYFDTPALDFYHAHHAGRATRQKVRLRTYRDSGAQYLELKRRTNKGRTFKSRLPHSPEVDPLQRLQGRPFAPLGEDLPAGLRPTTAVDYTRVTLVANDRRERLTLDLGVTLSRGAEVVSLAGVVIAEVKQPWRAPSPFLEVMRRLNERPTSFSKYCLSVICLYEEAKSNRYRPLYSRLQRIVQENGRSESVAAD